MSLNKPQIEQIVERALSKMEAEQQYLINADVSERAITHHIAKYMEQQISKETGLSVDVEYNRDGNIPKKLYSLKPRWPSDREHRAVTVLPDIIIHERGTGINLVVLEIKKLNAKNDEIEFDRKKLEAYKEEYGYKYAAHVFIGGKKDGQNILPKVEWI